jgi:hypothetical protein
MKKTSKYRTPGFPQFRIEVRYAKGWRKARQVEPFLLRSAAESYARKYLLAGWWRVVCDAALEDASPPKS